MSESFGFWTLTGIYIFPFFKQPFCYLTKSLASRQTWESSRPLTSSALKGASYFFPSFLLWVAFLGSTVHFWWRGRRGWDAPWGWRLRHAEKVPIRHLSRVLEDAVEEVLQFCSWRRGAIWRSSWREGEKKENHHIQSLTGDRHWAQWKRRSWKLSFRALNWTLASRWVIGPYRYQKAFGSRIWPLGTSIIPSLPFPRITYGTFRSKYYFNTILHSPSLCNAYQPVNV